MDIYICYQCAVNTPEICTLHTAGAENESCCKPAFVPAFPVWPLLPVGSLISWNLWSPHREVLAGVMTSISKLVFCKALVRGEQTSSILLMQLKLQLGQRSAQSCISEPEHRVFELSCVNFNSVLLWSRACAAAAAAL